MILREVEGDGGMEAVDCVISYPSAEMNFRGMYIGEEDRREIENTHSIGDLISFPNANTIIFEFHSHDHQPAHPKPAT